MSRIRPTLRASLLFLAALAACDAPTDPPASPTEPEFSSSASAKDGSGGATTTGTTLKGEVSNLAGTCPTVSFTLSGKTVKTSAATTYGDRACADVKNGVMASVVGAAQADGSILAAQVRVAAAASASQVSLKGAVSNLTGTCPTVSFTLSGKTVKTSAATTYGDRACADVKNGVMVSVVGAAQADGSILAAQVRVAAAASTSQVSLKGAVSNLAGTCPTVSFTLSGKTVKTSAATTYGDRACADVKNGATVGVMGTAQADGSILAAQVRVAAPEPVPAITGALTGVSGTCPALTLSVGDKRATTNSSTKFEGRACADLKAGVTVAIYGSVPAGGSPVVATLVKSK